VVGCVGVSDSEADRDTIEETDLRRGFSFPGEVLADAKNEFVLTNAKFTAGQQRFIGSPIGIRSHGFQKPWLCGVKGPKFNLHALRGTAMGGVKDVGAEPGRHEN
jgi:hypothetical protein